MVAKIDREIAEEILNRWELSQNLTDLARAWLLHMRPNEICWNCEEYWATVDDLKTQFLKWVGG